MSEESRKIRAMIAELTRLREENKRLKEALKPFVVPRDGAHSGAFRDDSPAFGIDGHVITVGDFRRARAAYKGGE